MILSKSILFMLFYTVVICISIIYMDKFIIYKMLLNPISTVIKHFYSNKNKIVK